MHDDDDAPKGHKTTGEDIRKISKADTRNKRSASSLISWSHFSPMYIRDAYLHDFMHPVHSFIFCPGCDSIQRSELLRPSRQQGGRLHPPRRRRLHARVQEVRGRAASQGPGEQQKGRQRIRKHTHEDWSHLTEINTYTHTVETCAI